MYHIIFMICVLCVTYKLNIATNKIIEHNNNTLTKNRNLQAKKYTSFGGSLESFNVLLDCKDDNNHPICCGLSSVSASSINYNNKDKNNNYKKCKVEKKYISSKFELNHFNKAKELDMIDNVKERTKEFIKYVTSTDEISNSINSLGLIKTYSNKYNNSINIMNKEELYYLSYYNITEICYDTNNDKIIKNYIDYIEPITIHGRHPFSLGECEIFDINKEYEKNEKYYKVGKESADYVLVSQYNNNKYKYLFDAGSAPFRSATLWLLCAYLQHDIKFNHIYGWEAGSLSQNEFWKEVPLSIKPYYSFYNVPVRVNEKVDSPFEIIKRVANENDFVSFKLDIDTPSVEIPLVQTILSDKSLSNLIDEFFFELHFKCEIMTRCSWVKIPNKQNGMNLNRLSAMELFLKLRDLGLRAHFWI